MHFRASYLVLVNPRRRAQLVVLQVLLAKPESDLALSAGNRVRAVAHVKVDGKSKVLRASATAQNEEEDVGEDVVKGVEDVEESGATYRHGWCREPKQGGWWHRA